MNVAAADAVMVGDSVRQDVDGALRAGMRAVLLHRGPEPASGACDAASPSPRSRRHRARLRELPGLIVLVDRLSGTGTCFSRAATACAGRRADADGCGTRSGRRRGSY